MARGETQGEMVKPKGKPNYFKSTQGEAKRVRCLVVCICSPDFLFGSLHLFTRLPIRPQTIWTARCRPGVVSLEAATWVAVIVVTDWGRLVLRLRRTGLPFKISHGSYPTAKRRDPLCPLEKLEVGPSYLDSNLLGKFLEPGGSGFPSRSLVVPFYPFLGEGSTTKIDYRKKLVPLF